MKIYQLGQRDKTKELLKSLGVQSAGISIMAKKMSLFYFYIKDLRTPAANILKQDALSIGADLAVPKGVITCEDDSYDCILIANKKQVEILSKKELAQPFGLKNVALFLDSFLKKKSYHLEIMGVINANDDSFYAKSRFSANEAISTIEKIINDGANIVDIGAVSSRPGSDAVPEEEELNRIKEICDTIKEQKFFEKATFSIDSYSPLAIEYALKSGFSLVNDISGASDDRVIDLAVKYNAKLCIMHMQGEPKTMQHNPTYSDVTAEVDSFFEERIAKCEELGMSRSNIILDVGIGFGKTLEHNLTLIQNLQHFEHFGSQLLIGASRKSMINAIVPTPIEERLPGTLALHLKAVSNGASIVRCHDVAEHRQALAVWNELQ